MIKAHHWTELKAMQEHLDEAWEHLKSVRETENRAEIQRATMHYFHALEQVYASAQEAVSQI